MDMAVEVEPTVEVVLETGDGVMTKHNVVFAIFDFKIIAYFGEALQEASIVTTVMVALDKDDVAVELFEDFNRLGHIAPEHVAEYIDGIAGVDCGVPSTDDFCIMVHNGFEGAIVKSEDVDVAEVEV